MIIQPSLPGGIVIFCDDIRAEVSGKLTLVGTYSGELTAFGDSPVIVPQLHMLTMFRNLPQKDPYVVKIVSTMIGESGEETTLNITEATIPPSMSELIPKPFDEHSVSFLEMRNIVQVSPLILNEPGRITVRAYIADDEIRLGTLIIKIAEPANLPVAVSPRE